MEEGDDFSHGEIFPSSDRFPEHNRANKKKDVMEAFSFLPLSG